MRIETAGENSLIVYLGDAIDPQISALVQRAVDEVREQLAPYLIELVPSYASVLVVFDVLRIGHGAIRKQLEACLTCLSTGGELAGKQLVLPVYYSEESGPDLAALALSAGLSIAELVSLHTAVEYRVYAIGFAPGFAYLGEVDERIAAPRLATPRARVPAGAVAIAERQTAVYPAASPGGWNLIGLCPTPMFQPQAQPSMPVEVGDRVRFSAIDRREFLALGGSLESADE